MQSKWNKLQNNLVKQGSKKLLIVNCTVTQIKKNRSLIKQTYPQRFEEKKETKEELFHFVLHAALIRG